MIDLLSIIIGILIVVLIIFMYMVYQSIQDDIKKMDQIYPGITGGIVGEEPYCPDCQCGDLELINLIDGVPWLKGYTDEKDFFRCKKCGRVFSDEDWKTAKVYTTQGEFVD